MKRRMVSGIVLTLLLIGASALVFNIQSVNAVPKTWTVDDDGPADFSKIQDAINAASDGDTIFVYNGIYYENVIVSKSVSLVGESREMTIVDGGGIVDVLLVIASEVLIANFTVRNCGLLWYAGIALEYVNYCNITNNIITNNLGDGVSLVGSSNTRICSNSITANLFNGILVVASSNNIVCLNNIANNHGGIFLLASSDNSIFLNSMTANGAYGICLHASSDSSIRLNSIVDNVDGIRLEGSSKNSICSNGMTANIEYGIYLWGGSDNIVCSNNVINNGYGVFLRSSSNNRFRDNAIANSKYNFGVLGSWLPHFTNDVDVSNTINGKPIYCMIGRSDLTVPSDAGYVALVNCTNMKVENLNLKNNFEGVLLYYTKNSTITRNNIANNHDGVRLQESSNNTVCLNKITASEYDGVTLGLASNNTICSNCITANNWNGVNLFESSNNSVFANHIAANNYCGVRLFASSNNSFYHNNFVDNEYQARVMSGQANTWDDGYPSGGNYWSDYTSRYPDAQELDDSGIWDTPYVINENNQDNYPLVVNPFVPIPSTVTATVDIDPDTLNFRSRGEWVTAYIQLLEGYGAEDINATTILLNGTVAPVLDTKYGFVTNSSEYLVDHNGDGILERMVKFDRAAVESFIYSQGFRYGSVALTLAGELFDGTLFEGTDVVFVNYAGDVNGDGTINVLDAAAVSAHWYPGPPAGPLGYDVNADLNKDGAINILDSGIVSSNWGQTVP